MAREASHLWSTLPAELVSLILSFAWYELRKGTRQAWVREERRAELCTVSSQWAQEIRRHRFTRIGVKDEMQAQWLLNHLAEEAEGKLVWPFALLIKRVDIEGTMWHILDKAAYIAQVGAELSHAIGMHYSHLHRHGFAYS